MMNLVASTRNKRSRRVLVYGAGSFGQLLVREMRANPDWQMNPVAFIDDDPMKAHRWITGVPVRGALAELEATLRRYSIDASAARYAELYEEVLNSAGAGARAR